MAERPRDGSRRGPEIDGPLEPQCGDLQGLISGADAAGLLEVSMNRLAVMIDQDLLDVVDVDGEQRFARAEVLAVRLLGG